jgi:hypothetical protein
MAAIMALAVPARLRGAEELRGAVSLPDSIVSRGDTIRIEIRDTCPAQAAEVILERNGRKETLSASCEPAAGGRPAAATAPIKGDAKFGTYSARIVLGGRTYPLGPVTIGPQGRGAVTLAEFDPADTYQIEPFLVPAAKQGEQPQAIPTVRLVLRGKGFIESAPSDNTVWINQVRQDGIQWDEACSDANFTAQPRAHAIHGEVRSPEEMRLCFVPVPTNGRLLVAAGFGDTAGEPRLFRVFSTDRASVALLSIVIAFVLAIIPLFLLAFVRRPETISGRGYRFRMLFLDPETNTYSLSKLQFYLWTVAALFGYAYLFISRVHVQGSSWPDVPVTLPGVIVVAAGTAVGSQIVSTVKGSKGAGEERPSLADFVTSGGVVAADRVQMLLWTLLGFALFLYSVWQLQPGSISEATFPAVPERLLVLMGISSAGYLGGKMARKPGPVISGIAVTPQESDDVLRDQKTSATVLPDLSGAVLLAKGELAKLPTGATGDTKAATDALKSAIEAASAAQTTAEFNQLMADLPPRRGEAEAAAQRLAKALIDLGGKDAAAEAQTAQSAAAALQELTAAAMEAISVSAAPPMRREEAPELIPRTIELRGTNLSPDATLRIDDAELPFQMLFNKDGKELPDVVIRDEANPTFARVLKFSIDPARLGGAYRAQIDKWFGRGGAHTFRLFNPDGQLTEATFKVGGAS